MVWQEGGKQERDRFRVITLNVSRPTWKWLWTKATMKDGHREAATFNLTCLWLDQDARYVAKYFWVHLWACFFMRLAFKSMDSIKSTLLSQCEWELSSALRVCQEQKEKRKLLILLCCLPAWAWMSHLVFCVQTEMCTIWSPGPQAFRFILELCHQLTDGRSWDFLTSIITWGSLSFCINAPWPKMSLHPDKTIVNWKCHKANLPR